jgi:hypothetical protein
MKPHIEKCHNLFSFQNKECYRTLRRVALVTTEVSEESSAPILRVTRIGEVATTLAVTINGRTLQRNTIYYILYNT